MELLHFIKQRVDFPEKAVKNTLQLLEEGATIPFIARYRKERTGNLDEVEIGRINELRDQYAELEKRKNTILKAVEAQNALTEKLRIEIQRADALSILEDLYLPFRKKRRTKADAARENELEGLAKIIMAQNTSSLRKSATSFLNSKIKTVETALQGAGYIIAEWINENQIVRNKLRQLYRRQAVITTKVVKGEAEKPEAQKYRQYFEWSEALKRILSHRFLAIYRAEKEQCIRIKVEVDEAEAVFLISAIVIKREANQEISEFIQTTVEDSYKRLLKPSFSTEFLNEAKKTADEEAISVFASNLEQLLMQPPLGGKRILAIDPGFKSGCKVVCLDQQGSLLHNENIYPHPPQREVQMAAKKIGSLVNAYRIEAIAIGNGTASRETEDFIKNIPLNSKIAIFVVNEAGASIYSASRLARTEFPDHDVTVRGAVSIGRRLSDPLSELVKIDPKAIGVGQYQHEVDQHLLKNKLDMVVMSCVNRIGVNINTASKELLSYVSGIGTSLAENILVYRSENGGLKNRKELLKIPRFGAKAFEQAAGFLRIKNGEHPLDDSAVHPESYIVVEKISKDQGLRLEELIGNKNALQNLDLTAYITEDTGMATLKDIIAELEKPGADPREKISRFQFDPSVKTIQDLKKGMRLPGLVNNITNFGCFVDIGIKESGLVHISRLTKDFVKDVNTMVKLNQQLTVTVLDVDLEQKRIQLSLID